MISKVEEKQKQQQDDEERQPRRKKLIQKDRKKPPNADYVLIWTLISKEIKVKNLLILPGDCILPLTNNSLLNLIEDIYIKNSSVKTQGNLELTLSRKLKPFRDVKQLILLIQRISSPWIPKVKQLLLGDYSHYIEQKKKERRYLAQYSKHRSNDFQTNFQEYMKNLPEAYYRYQVRVSNQDYEMELKKVGFSQKLIDLLYPQPTDILVQNTPIIFSTIESYIKYMYYNLLSLVNGGVMDWIEIELETVDDITISTRFKNIYYTSPASDQLVTITVFEISQNAIDNVTAIRQSSSNRNVLTRVNPQAEKFFNKFYSTKEIPPKHMCGYMNI